MSAEPGEIAAADDQLVAALHPSPNHTERRGGATPTILVLHYTGMPSLAGALDRLTDPASEVSAHYVVAEDGRILQLVPETRRAWHAGAGTWAGLQDVNSWSIGIEIANGGHPGGLPPYPDRQIDAVIGLASGIVGRWRIWPDMVVAHSDVAPDRKEDPGELFPWDRLAEAGIGRWLAPTPLRDGPSIGPGDTGQDVAALREDLRRFGYGIAADGAYDTSLEAVVRAFQRHHRPTRVDGVADPSTRDTLRRLLRPG